MHAQLTAVATTVVVAEKAVSTATGNLRNGDPGGNGGSAGEHGADRGGADGGGADGGCAGGGWCRYPVGTGEAVAVDRGAAERDANELGVGEGGETNAGKGGVDVGANRD